MEARIRTRLTDPQISSILLMGGFDFWGKADRPARHHRPSAPAAARRAALNPTPYLSPSNRAGCRA